MRRTSPTACWHAASNGASEARLGTIKLHLQAMTYLDKLVRRKMLERACKSVGWSSPEDALGTRTKAFGHL
jgi:hypothetical protein